MTGLEGLAAVSLAGNILQFITTTKHLLSTTREVLDTGAKVAHRELEIIAKDLQYRVKALSSHTEHPDDTLEALAVQCEETADTLLGILTKLRLNEDRDKWNSFLQALRSQWHESEIEALRIRLNNIGQSVHAHLADERQLRLQAQLDELLERNQHLEATRNKDLQELKSFVHEVQLQLQLQTRQGTVDVDTLARQIAKITLEGGDYSAEQEILQFLRFPLIEDRYTAISPAHLRTLSWIFDSGVGQGNMNNPTTFVQWLESTEDLYWISGRPASGKSTLMKFLYSHESTREYLGQWAGGDEVLIAGYFFWNAGKNELQKSQEGLLRSLLYQLLRKHPDSIRQVFPGAWQLYSRDMSMAHDHLSKMQALDIADIPRLISALQRTCDLLAQCKKRFCFFIDGLDEYSGNANQIVGLVQTLRVLKQVKICVSSRPWNEFQRAYGKSNATKLLMEDFNHQDISAYVNHVLGDDEDYRELQDVETNGKMLLEETVTSANGVFLWVVLVVESLLIGLREGDGIDRLRSRLQGLPIDLEKLFERILFNDVEPTHRERAARMFLMTLKAKDNLPLMAYWYLDEPEAITERQPLRLQQTIYRHKAVKKKLTANGKGLLETRLRSISGPNLSSAILFNFRVDFLHRTVREYLELPTTDLHTWLCEDFDTDKAICNAVFSQIKTAPHEKEYAPYIGDLYSIFAYHYGQAETDTALEKSSVEIADIVSTYGVQSIMQQAPGSTAGHAGTTASRPTTKQPSTARKLFRKRKRIGDGN
ncbi:hypothetical protein E8E13_001087 [Curvularia kusanoi]|uniref:NACHT domain-containing protein n=1 Tax=Curvularia kusanoi TaxID=90978 RepID=A0A9P4W3B5_CURKU|nr:hypothetical protein E8E13_001087 [Curvularia kusanoi]